ncbi:PDZ domain-containing protein [Alteromonas sp. ASW11-19]|uniref:PDZ domain-containing protein n=1 Tax=Alteromonas salexigens TaxID=2982530 RepID=A0ABT2VMB7_9ALTE|nr:PDZ domain-containing protein [Alteromonas salexigens]MCU7554214.1 PDZ domain-containing protein [Alteromonas salexigens]
MLTKPDTLSYALAVSAQQPHTFDVSVTIPSHQTDTLTLTLPAWIPGSYMIRDFARNITALAATTADGNIVSSTKTDKQTWQINAGGQAVTVNYSVYAYDLSVRSAFINDEYAFCNGTSVFLKVSGMDDVPCTLTLTKPAHKPAWQIETSMPNLEDRDNTLHFQCEDYDELIDHPIFIGECSRLVFTENGVEFVMLFSGTTDIDIDRVCRDLAPVCRHHMRLFGDPQPVERYVFMTLLSDTGFGGLEHRSSTALLFPRFDLPLNGDPLEKTDAYITFLSLCSHELFHTWHVKRIKPDVMVKPDLLSETYTEQLWIYEGFTSFYDDLTLARVGLITPEKYLDIVAQNNSRLLVNAGRFKQSAAQSSFDAWTRFYKQDASATNQIVSYYTKGGIIALGLDLLIREQSNHKHSLDDVMRVLWTDYGREIKGTPDEVITTICQHHFNIDVSDYLNDVVYHTRDVPLDALLHTMGVTQQLRQKVQFDDKGGRATSDKRINRAFGAVMKNLETGVLIQVVRENTPAAKAGLQVNDKLLAVEDYVVTSPLVQRMLDATSKKTLKLLVLREGRVVTLELPVTEAEYEVCQFTITDTDKFQRWLNTNG